MKKLGINAIKKLYGAERRHVGRAERIHILSMLIFGLDGNWRSVWAMIDSLSRSESVFSSKSDKVSTPEGKLEFDIFIVAVS